MLSVTHFSVTLLPLPCVPLSAAGTLAAASRYAAAWCRVCLQAVQAPEEDRIDAAVFSPPLSAQRMALAAELLATRKAKKVVRAVRALAERESRLCVLEAAGAG